MLVFNQYTTGAKGPVVGAVAPLDSLDSTAVLCNILAWTLAKRKHTSTELQVQVLAVFFSVVNETAQFFPVVNQKL